MLQSLDHVWQGQRHGYNSGSDIQAVKVKLGRTGDSPALRTDVLEKTHPA